MNDLGEAIFGIAFCVLVIAIFVWLTWYVVLWLVGALVLYLVFRHLAKRTAKEVEILGTGWLRQSFYEGLRDTVLVNELVRVARVCVVGV